MLLFGFSVLAALLCALPGDVFSGAIGTSNADREKENVENYGIYGNYCQKSRKNWSYWLYVTELNYPPTPVECCYGREMQCKNYINPGETKLGLRNEDSWPMRECHCEYALFNCLMKAVRPYDRSRAVAMLNPEMCIEVTGCEGKSTLGCTQEYTAISVKTLLSRRIY